MANLVTSNWAVKASCLIAVLCLTTALSAQVEDFDTGTLPAGWSMVTTTPPGQTAHNYGNNMWAVDNDSPIYNTSNGTQGAALVTSHSGAFSLNYNDGVDTANGVIIGGAVRSPVYDLSFAAAPKLEFWHMQVRYYYYSTTAYMISEVKVWDENVTTLLHTFNLSCTNTSRFCDWKKESLALDKSWGRVRIEFVHSNGTGTYNYQTGYQRSNGWFIDDVEITGSNPVQISIGEARDLNATMGAVNANPGGTNVSQQFTALEAPAPGTLIPNAQLTWSVASGSQLPPGLAFSAAGVLSGQCTSSGNYSFTLHVDRPMPGNPVGYAQWDEKVFDLQVNRSTTFNYPIMSIPYYDDFGTDNGWQYNDVSFSSPTGPGGGPYATNNTTYQDTAAVNNGWTRGAATQAGPYTWNNDKGDPGTDHSNGSNNMLLGNPPGNQWPTTSPLNEWHYAYSPQIVVDGFRTVDVEFWRWVNAYYYYIKSRAEIWNPITNQWMLIWEITSYSDGQDAAWKKEIASVDFGSQPTGGMTTRIRFGWGRYSSLTTSYYSSGMNIDDVRLIEKPQPGVLVMNELEVLSQFQVGSSPKVFVGDDYAVRIDLENTSSKTVRVHTVTYSFHLGGTPEPVGTLTFTPAVPWDIPPSYNGVFSPTASNANMLREGFSLTGGTVDIDFDCTALAQYGNGTSVVLTVELLGFEHNGSGSQTPGVDRATVTSSLLDPCGDEVVTIFQRPPLTITDNNPLPDAPVSLFYNHTLTAQFGTPPYHSWAITAQSGPVTATISNSGTISFLAPAGPGVQQVTVEVYDSATPTNAVDTKTFSINIVTGGAQPLRIVSGPQLPNATEGLAYPPFPLVAAGGVPGASPAYTWGTPTNWSPSNPGFTWNASTQELGGTMGAGTLGAYSFELTVTDSVPSSVTQTFYVSVLPANPFVGITTSANAPPDGKETLFYNGGTPFQFNAQGGITSAPGIYAWSISSGALPDGLVLDPDTGELSGLPSVPGLFDFTVRAADGQFPASTDELNVQVQIDALIPPPLVIVTNQILPAGAEGTVYSTLLKAQYGITPYTWALETGSTLPTGLTLSPNTGEISGIADTGQAATPDEDFTFTVELRDSSGAPQPVTKTFQLNLTAFITGPLTITTATALPEAGVENPYSVQIIATGGSPANPTDPYIFDVAAGSSLPIGLSLDVRGTLDGIPNIITAGDQTFTLEVTDGVTSVQKQFTLKINGWPNPNGNGTELNSGRRITKTVPFWEGCVVGGGSGMGILFLGGLALAAIRRRREED